MDGTDFRIFEPTPFNCKWFSHKFHGPGVRYEVAVALHSGHIVWINGPFPCGRWPDLRIARESLIYQVNRNERMIADGGYKDNNQYFTTPNGINDAASRWYAVARARHETVNRRFKQFNVLCHVFRHSLRKHYICFSAVVNITQLSLETDQPLFQVR